MNLVIRRSTPSIAALARAVGLNESTVRNRLNVQGLSLRQALSHPLGVRAEPLPGLPAQVTDDFEIPGEPLAHLRGSWHYFLDAKGRTVIPPEFRADRLYLTRGKRAGVLVLVHGDRFEALTARWLESERDTLTYLAGAHPVRVDAGTGRILIPHDLREWAGMSRGDEIVVAGVGTCGLICRASRWDELLREGVTR